VPPQWPPRRLDRAEWAAVVVVRLMLLLLLLLLVDEAQWCALPPSQL
jgi:hypothetical protein